MLAFLDALRMRFLKTKAFRAQISQGKVCKFKVLYINVLLPICG